MAKWFERGGLPALLLVALAVSVVSALWSDLPTGDEINTYIFNGAEYARTGCLPAVSENPLVAVVYGVLIALTDRLVVTLSGVLVSHVVCIASHVLAVFFAVRTVRHVAGVPASLLVGTMLAVFPGCFFVTRGDLSLYLLFGPMLGYGLVRVIESPSAGRAALAGCVAGVFYLSRADGLYVSLLTFAAFAVFYRPVRRLWVVFLLCFALIPGWYLVLRHHSTGGWGKMSSNRAVRAFYQAEGEHDGLGGSWHDYTIRGEKRFGPPEKYGNSMVRLVVSNLPAVMERAGRNVQTIAALTREASRGPWWVAAVVALGGLFTRPLRQSMLLLVMPCVVTCGIYLTLFFGREYFQMLSVGLAVALGLGFAGWLGLLSRWIPGDRMTAAAGLLSVALLLFFAETTLALRPGRRGETTARRYRDALVFVKTRLQQEPGVSFLAADFGGARSMYLYVDSTAPSVDASAFARLTVGDALRKCHKRGIRYVLAAREDEALWALSPAHADVAYSNAGDDVRVLSLKAE